MEQILKERSDANIIHINFEDFAFSNIQNAKAMYDYITARLTANDYNYIFIDEIQEVDNFEKVIRSLLLNEKNDI